MGNSAQIRAAASKLFATHGYEGVSLQAIADSVGVAKQTLLYHYPSKDLLRRAVIDQVLEHWRRTLPAVLQAVTSGRHRFTALTEELVRFFDSDRDRARLLARELLDNPSGTKRLLVESLRPWILLVSEYIREGQNIGLIRGNVDPESYVLHVVILVIANVANMSTVSMTLAGTTPGDAQKRREAEQRHLAELIRMTRTALFVREGIEEPRP
ncbi:MAG: helix-turn-helix domain-containing protein [Polyangiales bacterium]